KGWIMTPVKWVVDTVYNNGIVKMWNGVSHILGGALGSLPKVNLAAGGGLGKAAQAQSLTGGSKKGLGGGLGLGGHPNGEPLGDLLATVSANYHPSGRVRGPGGPVEDAIPAMLSDGEFVVRAAVVRQLGSQFFEDINNFGRVAWGDPSKVTITNS